MSRMCESCGMPMKKDDVKGTNKDGSKSEKYCALCYKDGVFIKPGITLEEIKELSIKGMREAGFPKFLAKFLAKNTGKLPRWQKQDTSKP